MSRDEAVALLQAIRAALATPAGRAIAREIAGELRRADEEAETTDPIGTSVDRALAKARRSDRVRASGKKGGGK